MPTPTPATPDPPTDLDGRVALVTGGTRGIGLAVAGGLAHRGATVVLVGRDPVRAHAAAAGLVAAGCDAVGVAADLADPDAVAGLAAALGPLAEPDLLVLAAGVMSDRAAKTLRATPAEWRRVLGSNLDAAVWCLQQFAGGMVGRRDGRIVALSACLGRFTGPGTAGGLAPYRVSKAALNATVKNLAAELGGGRRGVTVDAVCPGHCRTDMGGPDAPRSAEQGADTVLWLLTRALPAEPVTGLLWEDRQPVPW